MWLNNRDLFTYDWINIETFCVALFGIWFAYGVLACWLGGKRWNWFVKFILLTLAVLPMASIGAFDLLQTLWCFGATITYGRGITAYAMRRAVRKQESQAADLASPSSDAGFRTQWSIKNLMLMVTALAVLLILITKNTEDLELIPTVYAIGFGIAAGCVALLSTTIGQRASLAWLALAFIAATIGQYFTFSLISQEPTFSNLFEAMEGTSFIWGEIEDFSVSILLTIAFCFLLVGFCYRWIDRQHKPTPRFGPIMQVVISGIILSQCILIGDLFWKVSSTHPVRLNRFQAQADLIQEQALLIEKTELEFYKQFPPDETARMVSAVENQLKRTKEVLQNIMKADAEVNFVERTIFDSWDFVEPIQSYRNLARAFNFRSTWSASQSDYDAALDDAMQAVKLPTAFVDHRTLVTRLVAIAVEGIGAYQAAPIIEKASATALSRALAELLKLEDTEVDAEVDYQNDWALWLHSLNWLGRLQALCGEAEHRDNFESNIRDAVKRCHATRRQLIVMMALELHKRKHGALPDQLKSLSPEFLPAVPLDPYTDPESSGVLSYRRDGNTYLLYSVGPNGEDNGGCNDEFGYGIPDSESDLNFREAARKILLDEQNERKEALNEFSDEDNRDIKD